jgi:protein-disulfide isomerase
MLKMFLKKIGLLGICLATIIASAQSSEPVKLPIQTSSQAPTFPITAAPIVIPSHPEIADIVLGNPSSPLTFVNYSSINCAHCAKFDREALPLIKSKYIDTHQLCLIFKHFPIDAAAIEYMSLIVKQPHERWFALIDIAYQHQQEWVGKPPEKLAEILGLSKEATKEALDSEVTKELLMAKRFNAEKAGLDIPATPTFQILFSVQGERKSILINTGISPTDLMKILDDTLLIADKN